MPSLQTRIFKRNGIPFENLIALVIRPVVDANTGISAFWFSRYGEGLEGSSGDCDISRIPVEYAENGMYTSLRFRFWVSNEHEQAIRTLIEDLVAQNGFAVSDIRNYDDVQDLANARFLEGEITSLRLQTRRDKLRDFLHSSARLVVDMIVGPDLNGNFQIARNTDPSNPHGNTFESIHHLFCNLTNVTTTVLLPAPGTRMYPPQGMVELPVRY